MVKLWLSTAAMTFILGLPGLSAGQGCGPEIECYGKCYDVKDPGEQAECFTKHINDWPGCAGTKDLSLAYRGRGVAYYLLTQYDKAMADYNKAIEIDGRSVYAYSSRGDLYTVLAQNDKAVEDYTKALEAGSQEESDLKVNSPVHCARGLTYQKLGEYGKAITDLTAAIDLDPAGQCGSEKRGSAYSILGGIHYWARQYAKALVDYNNTIELWPDNAEAYMNRGNTRSALGQYEAAVADLNKSIELSSNVAGAYASRGVAYSFLGEYDGAARDFSRALELDPDMPYAHYDSGIIHSVLGRKTEAEAEFSRTEAIYSAQISSPTVAPELYASRGGVYLWAGKCEAARADFETALTLDKNNPDSYSELGIYWWHCRHNKQKALKWYKRSFEQGFTQWDSVYNKVADGHFLAGLNEDPDFKALLEKYKTAAAADLPPAGGASGSLAQSGLSNILNSLDAMAVLLKDPAVDGDVPRAAEMREKIAQDPKRAMDLVEWFSGGKGYVIDNEYFNILNLRPRSVDPAARAKEWETAAGARHAWETKFNREAMRVMKGLKVLGAESEGLDLALDKLSSESRGPYTPLEKVEIAALEHNLASEPTNTGTGTTGRD